MAFSTFTFRASGFFCEDCGVSEAQDDLQRRIHFRHFVAAHSPGISNCWEAVSHTVLQDIILLQISSHAFPNCIYN
jgi:hypothetical protein